MMDLNREIAATRSCAKISCTNSFT
jgi:hypothetical protein